MRSKHLAIGTAALAATLGLALTGCGSGSDSDGASASPSVATAGQLPSFPAVPADAKMTLQTDQGEIVITMDPQAPTTDASMAYLADKGYFNNTSCHRLTTQGIYVLQCGDPTGTGTGDPGYEIPDENLPADAPNNYPKGTVAMANAGPNTNGSQFFIVYQDTTLPPAYSIWGTVTSGMDVVEKVAAAGVEGGGTDGSPALPITITEAAVS